jgi:hypothetical protein
MQKATMDYNAKRARMIDPYYGRYGVHRRQTESYASALDGQLGFEINDAAEQATTLYKAGLELNMKRFDAFFEMQKNLQGALFKKNPFKNPFAGMAMVAEGKDIKELFDTSLKAVKDADAEAKNKVMGTLEITPLTDEQIRQVEEALKGEGGLNSLLADTSQTLYGGLTGREALQSYYSQKILNLTPHQLNLAQRQGAVSTSYLPEGYKMVTKLAVSSPIHDVYFKKN